MSFGPILPTINVDKMMTEQSEGELRQAAASGVGMIPYVGKPEEKFLAEEFARLQAQRKKERLAAAKGEVANALAILRDGIGDWSERNAEVAADAIENLIRTVMEDK